MWFKSLEWQLVLHSYIWTPSAYWCDRHASGGGEPERTRHFKLKSFSAPPRKGVAVEGDRVVIIQGVQAVWHKLTCHLFEWTLEFKDTHLYVQNSRSCQFCITEIVFLHCCVHYYWGFLPSRALFLMSVLVKVTTKLWETNIKVWYSVLNTAQILHLMSVFFSVVQKRRKK